DCRPPYRRPPRRRERRCRASSLSLPWTAPSHFVVIQNPRNAAGAGREGLPFRPRPPIIPDGISGAPEDEGRVRDRHYAQHRWRRPRRRPVPTRGVAELTCFEDFRGEGQTLTTTNFDGYRLEWLTGFLAVVDFGGFAVAAENTFRSQPRISTHVA